MMKDLGNKAIALRGLTKNYGKARGISGLTMDVEEGDFFGFIGPNGAGKSTTIRLLIGLLRPTEGECNVFGMDCWKEAQKVHAQVGYLPSENAFYPGMRVRDVLELSAALRGKDCSREAARLCEVLQLDTGRKAAELSFGNRKKLSVICALQHDPQLLILDEPTGGLDPLMQRAFFDILRERHRAGRTIFFSSHILTEVQENCDHIAVIRDGCLAACDSTKNLIPHNVKTVRFAGRADLAGLPGIRNLTREKQVCKFLYYGDTDALLRCLAAGHVEDVRISEPDLEEVFMHYYEEAPHGPVCS